MLKQTLLAAIATAAIALPAAAQESYVIGLTGAMTGPAAGTLGPAVEGLRLYIDKLNAAGGINGRKVNLILQDDSAEPSKAAANVKKLLSQDNVPVLVNSSLSSTYAPMLAETKRAGVPVLFMGAVCPKEVLPPNADPLQFCSTGFAQTYDSRAALAYVKSIAKGPVNVGYAAMAIPISRSRNRLCRCRGREDGLQDRGQGSDPAADAGLHAVRDQDQGRRGQLGVLLGAVGDGGAHVRSVASPRLAGRISHHRASRSRGRIAAPERPEILCDGREFLLRGRSADPQGDHRSVRRPAEPNIRPTR